MNDTIPKSFLQEVATQLKKQHTDFRNVICIFPNNRTSITFESVFTREKKAFFLPEITEIDPWVSNIAGLKILSNFEQLFFAYTVYNAQKPQTEKNKENADFILFLRWIEIALADFNEIDSHLINSEKIFPNIYDTERIKKWSPSEGVKSNEYLNFIKDLEKYYGALQENMAKKRLDIKAGCIKKRVKK